MGTISINGRVYTGNRVTINNSQVIIDGKTIDEPAKDIVINIEGNVETVDADCVNLITVKGDVGNIKTLSGDIECENVTGSVTTMSGDVDCDAISGSVQTMSGDIRHR